MVDKLKFIQWLIIHNKIETWDNWKKVEEIKPCKLNDKETYTTNPDKT